MSEDTKLGSLPLLTDQGGIRHFDNGVHMLQLWSNVAIIEAVDGVVIFDCGFEFTGPRVVEELRAITDKPVKYVIYGHGHADHAFGARAIIKDAENRGHPRPLIVAHENLPLRFDRYREMQGYHEHINRIQFAIPDNLPGFAKRYIYPDLTYRDGMSLALGEVTFELRHSKGETDDTTWMWVPDRKTVCVSDLWVWSCPNIGNPFKVQRYETEWAKTLEEIAAKGPELLLPGHGPAISGAEEIKNGCLTVARSLRLLHQQVVDMLNQGKWQEEILNNFEWPEEFAQSSWLAPIYGHPYFVVMGILRRYHGWYDGNPTHLFPSPGSEVAVEVVEMAGSRDRVLDRARALGREGRTQLALHLVDFAIQSRESPDKEALELKIELLEEAAEKEQSLIARNILLGGVRQIRKELEGE